MSTRILLILIAGLVAASQAANLIRIGDASPFAISFWRLFIASVILLVINGNPFQSFRQKPKRLLYLSLFCGLMLALHFFSWIASVQNTSVANAVLFFSLNPLFTVLFENIFLGEKITKKELMSLSLAFSGVAVVAYHDFSFSYEHLYGDFLSIVCAFFFAAYFFIGRVVLKEVRGVHYMQVVYMSAAIVSLVACIIFEVPIFDYSNRNWICFISLAIIPTILGHTFLNFSLTEIKASTVSILTLTEPVMATFGAYIFYGESINSVSVIGFILISLSAVMILRKKQPT